MKHRAGFTVVEVIVVVAAIAILAGIGTVTYTGLQRQARDDERIADMDVMSLYLETHREQHGTYPGMQQFYLGVGADPSATFPQNESIPASALTDPSDSSATPPHYSYLNTSEVIALGAEPSTWPSAGTYTYLSYLGAGTDICIEDSLQVCSRYVLYYKDEAGDLQTVQSKYGN